MADGRKTDETNRKLRLWQERYRRDLDKYRTHLDRMDRREELYRGDNAIGKTDGTRTKQGTPHVRNIVQEIIETQVDSNIPQPKVTAVLEEDEPLAKIIEDMLRNELDRLPMEELNDLSERTVPIQGGEGVLPEWDVTLGTHTSIGEIQLTQLHPKKIVPQDGVYRVEDMDWYFVQADKTKLLFSFDCGIILFIEELCGGTLRALCSGLVATPASDTVSCEFFFLS